MSKYKKLAATKGRAPAPVFDDDPAFDDPHDTIDQELLGIWLSISRLRQMIRNKPPVAHGSVIPLQRQAAPKKAAPKKSTPRKPRRKAA